MMGALASDDLRPRKPGGMGWGACIALLTHVALILALAFGVSWRTHEPAGIEAELWAAVPREAAPAPQPVPVAPPEPAPQPAPVPKVVPAPAPPRDADIATEKAEREKKERRREELEQREKDKKAKEREEAKEREAEVKAKAVAEQKRKKAEEEHLAKLRDENLKRMQGMVGGTGAPTSTGTAAQSAGPSASYIGRIIARIKPNIVVLDQIEGNPVAVVEVRAAPDGTIIGRRLSTSSGNRTWDEAVLRAIDRTEVLPRDVDGRVPSTIIIDFRPRD
jgi:colicin import membrane protein